MIVIDATPAEVLALHREIVQMRGQIEKLKNDKHDLQCAIIDAMDVLDIYSDTCDGDDGVPYANRAMAMWSNLEETLEKVK